MSKNQPKIKTLDDVMRDMSILYDDVRAGTMELRPASELTNIAGKYLKAYALQLAERHFLADQDRRVALVTQLSDSAVAQIAAG